MLRVWFLLCRGEDFEYVDCFATSVFAITYRRDIGLYDVPMLMSLLSLGIGMMLANFHT